MGRLLLCLGDMGMEKAVAVVVSLSWIYNMLINSVMPEDVVKKKQVLGQKNTNYPNDFRRFS